MTEEDIRTKIVSLWLADHGFAASDIALEFTFNIKIGRASWRIGSPPSEENSGERTLHPRADVLVSRNGRNLLVVEVKAPTEQLDDKARDQGISYARLLPEIVPFVVVTNGNESRVYDTITRKELTGERIPCDHPAVTSDFRVASDDLQLRMEASELFLSLSPDNLLEFCRQQCHFRMARLKSDDPESGKKYIPSLCVDRTSAKDRIAAWISDSESQACAIVGRPQVGKTNFICKFVDDYLQQGHPCLFFPAIGLGGALCDELAADMGWLLHDGTPSASVIVQKLGSVLQRTGSNLLMLIDGWNEATQDLARGIDRDCERLVDNRLRVIVSLTNSSAQRLFSDRGNPAFLCEAAGLSSAAAVDISIDPSVVDRNHNWHAVLIDRFDDKERDEAYTRYATQFGVTVPTSHTKTSDPFLLAAAMRHASGGSLPTVLDERTLLQSWLEARIHRIQSRVDARSALCSLGDMMLTGESPVSAKALKDRWQIPVFKSIPAELFEGALLSSVFRGDEQSVDFYHSRDKDLVIAIWVAKWDEAIDLQDKQMFAALESGTSSPSGQSALDWFMRQPDVQEKLHSRTDPILQFDNQSVRLAFFSGLASVVARGESESSDFLDAIHDQDEWWEFVTAVATNDPDLRIRIEAAKVIAILSETFNREDVLRELQIEPTEELAFYSGLLQVHAELPLVNSRAGSSILKLFADLHYKVADWYEYSPSSISETLLGLVEGNDRFLSAAAGAVVAHIEPIEYLRRGLRQKWNFNTRQRDGLQNAIDAIEEQFIGSPMCRSYLDWLCDSPDEATREYTRLKDLWNPLTKVCRDEQAIEPLFRLLSCLENKIPIEFWGETSAPIADAPGQLYLDFEADDR